MKIDGKAMEAAIVKAEMERMEKDLRDLMMYSDPLVSRIFKLYQEELEERKSRQHTRRVVFGIVCASACYLVFIYQVTRGLKL